jgi:hypothetical protein
MLTDLLPDYMLPDIFDLWIDGYPFTKENGVSVAGALF